MNESNVPSIRSALAEHVGAYAEVATSATRQWSSQVARRVVGLVVAAIFAFLTLMVGIFVVILASWDTPYRWWVAGGILLLLVVGIAVGLVAAQRVLRTLIAPPWAIVADQLATDLRGLPGQPASIGDDLAAQRLQNSREQLQSAFAYPGVASGGAKIGLGIAGLLLMTLVRRRTRTMGGIGLLMPIALAGLRMWRRRKAA